MIRAWLRRRLAARRIRCRTCPTCRAIDCTSAKCANEWLEMITW